MREGRGRKGDKTGAIAKLREVQAGGKKRSEQYSAPDETPIYEEVNDDHYKKLRMADDFVVDEGCRSLPFSADVALEGYTVNYGEDEEIEEEEASKQRALEAQRKKDAKKRGAFNVPTKAKVTEAPAKNTYVIESREVDLALNFSKENP